MEEIIKTKEAPKPSPADKSEFLDLETQILIQITKAIKGHRMMEAYMLSWTTIEQFMLPKLISFVSKNLNVDLPKNISELPVSQVIRTYYLLSQDKTLYESLEKARKKRNELIHELYKQSNWTEIKKNYRKGLKQEIKDLFELFQDRFTGKTQIPSLTVYSRGWNDCREEILKRLNNMIDSPK